MIPITITAMICTTLFLIFRQGFTVHYNVSTKDLNEIPINKLDDSEIDIKEKLKDRPELEKMVSVTKDVLDSYFDDKEKTS